MNLDNFNSKYIYTPDPQGLDIWDKCEFNGVNYKGDCESYLLSLIADVDGFKNLELWYCKLNGIGHCVGKLNNKWIDCVSMELIEKFDDRYTDFEKYSTFQILSKKVFAKIYKFYTKVF